MSNLRKRGVSTDGLYLVCGLEDETILHALCSCNAMKEVWRLWKDCQIDLGPESLDFLDIALKVLVAGNLKDLEILFVVVWAIWHNRNLRVFESVCQGVEQIWNYAVSLIFDFKEAEKFCSLGPNAGDVSGESHLVECSKSTLTEQRVELARCLVLESLSGTVEAKQLLLSAVFFLATSPWIRLSL